MTLKEPRQPLSGGEYRTPQTSRRLLTAFALLPTILTSLVTCVEAGSTAFTACFGISESFCGLAGRFTCPRPLVSVVHLPRNKISVFAAASTDHSAGIGVLLCSCFLRCIALTPRLSLSSVS